MFKMGLWPDSNCPRCNCPDAHLLHMLWGCTALQAYWTAVVDLLNRIHNFNRSPNPKLCVLGITDDLDSETPIMLSVSRLLFQARKLIAQHWIRPTPPALSEYTSRVNNIIRLEKAVYVKRNTYHKFEAIWGPWLDTPGLPSQILLQNRIRWPE